MKTLGILTIGITLYVLSANVYAQANITIGGVYAGNQVWYADTVKITDNVTVIGTLNIAPGTYIELQGHYEIYADTILALGLPGDSITFTINDTTGFSNRNIPDGGWKGLRADFYLNIDHCRIMFVKSSHLFYIYDDVIDLGRIRNSVLQNNICSLFVECDHHSFSWCYYSRNQIHVRCTSFTNNDFRSLGATGIIDSCRFTANSISMQGSIGNSYFGRNMKLVFSADECSMLNIRYCIFEKNDTLKIFCGSMAHMYMVSSLFTNNYNIFLTGHEANQIAIVNNTFFNNHMDLSGSFTFCNNILCRRDRDKILIKPAGFVANNIIEGGLDVIEDSEKSGVEGNIDVDPLFVDTLHNDFHLTAQSPCINYTGISNLYEHLSLSSLDLDGNSRIYGISADIGAYEYQGSPDNRPPIMELVNTPKILPGVPSFVTVRFLDPDSGDICSISGVNSESPEIEADIISSDSVSVKINISAKKDWQGTGQIQIRVSDNHGHITSNNIQVIVSKVVCGELFSKNTVWGGDTVRVECDVIVGNSDTLTIQPGTTVAINKNCRLIVKGYLKAIGNDTSRITFTASDTNGFYREEYVGWGGIGNYIRGEYSNANFNIAIFNYCNFLYSTPKGEYGSTIYWRTTSNYGDTLVVTNCNFINNHSQSDGGAIFIHSQAVIHNNSFENNISEGSGGAVCLDYHSIDINNCAFVDNHAEYGGAVFNKTHRRSISNCLFVDNSAEFGGAISSNDELILINNTFFGNYAETNGGGVDFFYGGKIINCIFWNNKAGLSGNEIMQDQNSLLIKNSIIQDGIKGMSYSDMLPTNTLYTVNPHFKNSSANDFHLSENSFAINSGTTETSGFFLPAIDLDGKSRIADLYVDIGAYEYHSETFNLWQHPQLLRVCFGAEGQLIANASGGVSGYQWQKNGYDLPGATDRILIFTSLDTSQAGNYSCKVKSAESTFSSDTIPVIVDLPLTITGQTESFIACESTDTMLFLQASGDRIIEFSWLKDGLTLVSENQSELVFPSLHLSDNGVYKGILYNTCGSDTSDRIVIRVKPMPFLYLGNDTSIRTSDTLFLNAGAGFENYQWNTGEDNQSLMVHMDYPGEKEYWVMVTDTNRCTSVDTIIIKVEQLTPISDNLSRINLKVYPNPTSDILYITSETKLTDVSIEIYDMRGLLVVKKKIEQLKTGENYSLNLSYLRLGVYELRVGEKMIRIAKL